MRGITTSPPLSRRMIHNLIVDYRYERCYYVGFYDTRNLTFVSRVCSSQIILHTDQIFCPPTIRKFKFWDHSLKHFIAILICCLSHNLEVARSLKQTFLWTNGHGNSFNIFRLFQSIFTPKHTWYLAVPKKVNNIIISPKLAFQHPNQPIGNF